MPRMQILTSQEQELFSKPPVFNHLQRKRFFDLPKKILDIAHNLRNPDNQIGFLLSCGYFKATKRFFLPHDFHEKDIDAAANILGIPSEKRTLDCYSDSSRYRHQNIILKHYGFSAFKRIEAQRLETEVSSMAKMYLKPRLIFDRCVDWLAQKRIQIPTMRTITDMIRAKLQSHKTTMSGNMDNLLSDDNRALLDTLFAKDESQHNYRITLLKKLSQSTRPTKVKESIADFQCIHELYHRLSGLINTLGMEQSAIRHYAGSVMKSQIFQMQQRKSADRYIHAAAFVAHQYYRMQDNLVDVFLNVMTSFATTIANERKDLAAEQQEEQKAKLSTLMKELDKGVFNVIQSIRDIAHNSNLSDRYKVSRIQTLLDQKSFRNENDLRSDLAIMAEVDEETIFKLSEARSVRLQNRLSPILKAVTWHAEKGSLQLLKAIDHFKNKEGNISETAPTAFLSKTERKALIHEDGTFRVSLYKVFLFQHVAASIKSGNINVEHSYKHRPLDHYLISRERWHNEKGLLLERAGLQEFEDVETTLNTLDDALHEEYRIVNNRASENSYLSFNADGTFKIKTPALDLSETDPLQSHFPKRYYVSLAEILETVNAHSDMNGAFTHWQQTHVKHDSSRPALFASIIGLGCGIGLRKMARISSHVSESELDHTVNWRFSLENIREANDRVLMVMDKMELPNIYRDNIGKLHTASDGSKYIVRRESLHASSSFKYFGQEQGVSVNTFIDERNFLWYSTIMSAATRESMGVIDGLMHNDVVKSDIHSTDTHGYSEAVFGLTHMLGISFAPRLKGLKNQQLYIFKHHSRHERKDWSIAPDSYVNERIIRQNWDDFLRLVVTIKLKENSASDIFRRLNSYSRQHALYQTVKAFGQIIKSLFILRYLDDLELRQAIEK